MIFLAQVAADWWAPLSQLGFAGAMLFWFTQRAEVRLKAMEESIKLMPDRFQQSMSSLETSFQGSMSSLEKSVDRMAKAALLQILSFEQNGSTIRSQAKGLLDEMEDKQGNR